MIKLPTAFQVGECIRKITRRETSVTLLAKPGAAKLLYGGTFHGGDRTVMAMCAADIAFAAYSGAALSLIPARTPPSVSLREISLSPSTTMLLELANR